MNSFKRRINETILSHLFVDSRDKSYDRIISNCDIKIQPLSRPNASFIRLHHPIQSPILREKYWTRNKEWFKKSFSKSSTLALKTRDGGRGRKCFNFGFNGKETRNTTAALFYIIIFFFKWLFAMLEAKAPSRFIVRRRGNSFLVVLMAVKSKLKIYWLEVHTSKNFIRLGFQFISLSLLLYIDMS